MVTWLGLTNRLQRRLRETQTAAVTTTIYSTLLGELINLAKREVEDYWDWHVLRTDLTATTTSGVATLTITGSNERSRFYDARRLVYNNTDDDWLHPAPTGLIEDARYSSTDPSELPRYYELDSISAGVLVARFWPTPNAALAMVFPMVVPQADLAAAATVLTVPEYPVYLRAYMLALEERGEDGGTTYARVEKHYSDALEQAVDWDRGFNAGEHQMILQV